MSKKKRLQEIEALKLQVNELQKSNSLLREEQFNDDFQNVIKTLKKYGEVEYQIDIERCSFCPEMITNKRFTITFNHI
jgi:ribosomal protein L29